MIIRLRILGLLLQNYSTSSIQSSMIGLVHQRKRYSFQLRASLISFFIIYFIISLSRVHFIPNWAYSLLLSPFLPYVTRYKLFVHIRSHTAAIPKNLATRFARNGPCHLPGTVSRKSDNFAGQLCYRAVRHGTRDEVSEASWYGTRKGLGVR